MMTLAVITYTKQILRPFISGIILCYKIATKLYRQANTHTNKGFEVVATVATKLDLRDWGSRCSELGQP